MTADAAPNVWPTGSTMSDAQLLVASQGPNAVTSRAYLAEADTILEIWQGDRFIKRRLLHFMLAWKIACCLPIRNTQDNRQGIPGNHHISYTTENQIGIVPHGFHTNSNAKALTASCSAHN